jgi:hypothetical protein
VAYPIFVLINLGFLAKFTAQQSGFSCFHQQKKCFQLRGMSYEVLLFWQNKRMQKE